MSCICLYLACQESLFAYPALQTTEWQFQNFKINNLLNRKCIFTYIYITMCGGEQALNCISSESGEENINKRFSFEKENQIKSS